MPLTVNKMQECHSSYVSVICRRYVLMLKVKIFTSVTLDDGVVPTRNIWSWWWYGLGKGYVLASAAVWCLFIHHYKKRGKHRTNIWKYVTINCSFVNFILFITFVLPQWWFKLPLVLTTAAEEMILSSAVILMFLFFYVFSLVLLRYFICSYDIFLRSFRLW